MNRNLSLVVLLMAVFAMFSCSQKVRTATKDAVKEKAETTIITTTTTTTNTVKGKYFQVDGDPLNVKRYTLDNGLQVIMSVNKAEPRIMTNIAVRAGSKHDPADATGLAHYLEHMLFKGTSDIASLDWEKEKVLLQQISDLYEKHKYEKDPTKRKEIYKEIDKISNEAAKYVAANEYDKMVSSMGAKGTNAYTSVEQTVYVNDIPSNELDKWLQLESERFSELVLRLFHTELEAVYEEFNIGQDNDMRKSNQALRTMLFPTHPYGTQTTIGTGEHLKTPSHVKIHEYFEKYYVPNNMAIILAGDINPDDVIVKVKKYFGKYKAKDVNRPTFKPQADLTSKKEKVVMGQQDPYVDLAWKVDGGASNIKDARLMEMLTAMLTNGKAGLMDLNLNQKQRVLESDAWFWGFEDYLTFGLYGKPRQGQSLKEVEELMLEQLDLLKEGKFESWLMDAAIKNKKLTEIRAAESNQARVGAMTNAFVTGVKWEDYVKRMDDLSKITKQEVIDFAKKYLRRDNYVIVYKKTGEDKSVMKVEKPKITPVSVNREQMSSFTKAFMNRESDKLSPAFVDYKSSIKKQTLQDGLVLEYMENKDNELFSLLYIFEMGKNNNKKLPLAVNYLKYLGTDKYTAEQLQQEFFKLGLNFGVSSGNDRVYVSLNGLKESMEKGLELFEHILANAKGNEEALKNVKMDILLRRQNAKTSKNAIRRAGMGNYARYGKNSPFRDILSEKELIAVTPKELVDVIHGLTDYKHNVFYYGTKPMAQVAGLLKKYHIVPAQLKNVPTATKYPEVGGTKNEVYFIEFPMVQAEVLMMSKGTDHFNLDEYVAAELYNNYFGFGLSSIMFQEIRESRALAYSTYSYYGSPSKKDNAHYFQSYVGTQANKLKDAVLAVKEIINDMPVSKEQIEAAKASILKQIETERINGSSKYWSYRGALDRGYERDLREDVYKKVKSMTPEQLVEFQKKHIKDRKYVIMVLGEKKNIGKKNMDFLKTLGPVKELTLEELFGY